ncbi:MAG TPA: FAD-dependent oxidoreductase, partial [Polyangiaceae bacterium]
MPAFDVVVVGAGAAGTAAAWAAARAGARVSVLHDRAGATALYSGALDLVPWDSKDEPEARQAAEAAVLADAELAAFASELGILRLGHCMLASREGVARRALGSDRALLDLEPLAGKRVGVLDAERDDWDAALLAKSLSASPFAERTRTSFVPIPVRMLSAGHERRVAAYDFAALHDDPARLSALGEALRAERAAADAWLSGPWLGLERDSARELAALAGAPVGETTSKVGGPAGARFERARDRLLQRRGVEVRQARVSRVSGASGALFVALEGAEGTREVEAKAVVLASGGVAAGGIVLRWDPE